MSRVKRLVRNCGRRKRLYRIPYIPASPLLPISASPHLPFSPSPNLPISVSPASIDETSEVMKLAASEGWSVVPGGSGTWLDVGNQLGPVNLILSTTRLQGVVEHEPKDLVASAAPGYHLNAFNETLNRGGQWLPLDPPDDGRATLGGVVATAVGGAQQTGYGSPRTFVIGMKVVLADGKVCKAGGRVVKNVAGYDLCKLFTGSYGTLGIICEVTFKLRPRPAKETTISAGGSLASVFAAAWSVYKAGLFPVAIELVSAGLSTRGGAVTSPGEVQLLIRFAGIEKTVDFQIATAAKLLNSSALRDIEIISDDESIWRNLQLAPLANNLGLSYRIAVQPSQLHRAIETVIEHADGNRFGRRESRMVGLE